MYKTTNQGESWFPIMNSAYYVAGSALFYDSASDGLFVSTWGTTWSTRDLLVSWDEGSTWQAVPNSIPLRGYNGFAFENDSVCVVSTAYKDNGSGPVPTPWMRTTDAGKTWRQLAMDSECWQPLAIPGTETQFAITDDWGNVLRTDNLWDSCWVVYSFPFKRGYNGFTNGCIRGDSNNLFVQLNTGVYMSTDQGKSWKFLCGQPYDTAEHYDSQGNDIGDYNMYDHRFWVQYPYVSILTYPPTHLYESDLWMLNVDSMQYFPAGLEFTDGSKRMSVPAGSTATVAYSPETTDPIGIDTGHLVFHYDTNSLTLTSIKLPPSWTILDSSSANGTIILTFTADSNTAIDRPMVSLTFNTYLGSSSAKVYLDSTYLSGHRLNCDCAALSTPGPDSVELYFTGCGNQTILAAMEHEPPFSIESVVPNPASTALAVTGTGIREPGSDLEFQLFDALGNCVLVHHSPLSTLHFETALDVSGLPSGIYFLRISSGGYAVSRSVSIER